MMKWFKPALLAVSLISTPAVSYVDYDFRVRPPGQNRFDIGDLDHTKAYEFGIQNWNIPDGQHVVGATLTFRNIWDWTVEDDNLFITLLDDPSAGAGWENFGPGYAPSHPRYSPFSYQGRLKVTGDNPGDLPDLGDDFAGQGVSIGYWTDPIGGVATGFDLVFDFNPTQVAALLEFTKDGNFALGLDPDCHYYNDGVIFTVRTEVPEAASSLGLMAIALAGLTGFRALNKRDSK